MHAFHPSLVDVNNQGLFIALETITFASCVKWLSSLVKVVSNEVRIVKHGTSSNINQSSIMHVLFTKARCCDKPSRAVKPDGISSSGPNSSVSHFI